MRKKNSLGGRSSTIGARTSALPIAHGWFHPALKMRSKREEYRKRVERKVGLIEGYYYYIIIIIITEEASRQGVSAMPWPSTDDADDDDVLKMDGDNEGVVIIMVRCIKKKG